MSPCETGPGKAAHCCPKIKKILERNVDTVKHFPRERLPSLLELKDKLYFRMKVNQDLNKVGLLHGVGSVHLVSKVTRLVAFDKATQLEVLIPCCLETSRKYTCSMS